MTQLAKTVDIVIPVVLASFMLYAFHYSVIKTPSPEFLISNQLWHIYRNTPRWHGLDVLYGAEDCRSW
jgi:hypothetical protein